MTPRVPQHILPVIILATFAGTSLWFSGNAIFPDLQRTLGLEESALGKITIAIQLGFIFGTLVFAILAVADRVSPRLVFLICALAGSAANAAATIVDPTLWTILVTRFVAGFFLAGIYPVGMKIAASWFDRELGKALGFMVGALVLGTAFPHLLRGFGGALPWQAVVFGVSAFAALGGVLMYVLVPDGPHMTQGAKFNPRAVIESFGSPKFRSSAFGYFGHMWELYAFWAFVPLFMAAHPSGPSDPGSIAILAFCVIGIGALGCAGGGLLSLRFGSARVAFTQLSISGALCLISPVLFLLPFPLALLVLLAWGVVAPGDSPQFSALNSKYAPPQLVGSALTIVNSIGFSITIVAIAVTSAALPFVGTQYLFLLLFPGPVLGLIALQSLLRTQ